ncbi:hypothetical protein ACSBR2_042122 [Camellia fascicularis]
MAQNMNQPWLAAGDLNDFAVQSEKRSFSTNTNAARTQKLAARIDRCKLMDLGCFGPNLTWSNGRQGLANTLERLDREVCNTEWRLAFSEGAVKNLPRTYSDHSPLIVYTQGKIKLNTDGCARRDPREGGFGGVFRDETGLTIVLEKRMQEVIVETDSTSAETLLTEGHPQNCPFHSIVEDSQHLIIRHIMREGNKCADFLANLRANQMEHLVIVNDPPDEVWSQVVADMIGMAYQRI